MDWSSDGRRLAFTVNGPAHNPNVWAVDARTQAANQITRSDTGGISRRTFVSPRLVSFPTFDGRDIPAFLYTPAGTRPSGESPVILHVHGGPESQERPGFNPIYQYFVHRGYSVLAPNVRGSSGYGRTYIHLDDVRKRMDSVADLEYGNATEDGDFLREISPMKHIAAVKCPLMVLHGARDPRVPISETEKLVSTLAEFGQTVEYIRFEDEGHGFVKRTNRITAYTAIADFFDTNL